MSLLTSPVLTTWRHRDLLRQIVRRNVAMRHRGSVLGAAWMFATPLLMLAVYTFVFSVVFKVRWGTGETQPPGAFALTLLCGLAVFNIVSETLSASAAVVSGNVNYVKKVVFPLEILPVSSLLTALVFSLVWFGILVVGIVTVMGIVSPTMLALPLVLLPLLLLTCGLAWFLASLGAYLKDVNQVLAIVLQVLFFLTPIFYSAEMIPEHIRPLIYLSPLTSVVENTRAVLIESRWPDWIGLGVYSVVSVLVFVGGFAWFARTKKGFADVL